MTAPIDPGTNPPPAAPVRPASTIDALRLAVARRDLFSNLVRRELRVRYRRSVLGWGWSLAQPLLMSVVYVIVLGKVFRVQPDVGDPSGMKVHAFHLLAALLPWAFLANGLTTAMSTLLSSAAVITKVNMPREMIPAAAITGLAVSLCIELAALGVVETASGHVMLHLLPIALVVVALQLLFVSGLGFCLSALNIRYRDVQHLTGVLLTVWMYLTPILYAPTRIPEHATVLGVRLPWRSFALANPMARFVIAYRNLFYDFRLPDLGTSLWCIGWAVATFVLGYRFFRARSPYFVEDL